MNVKNELCSITLSKCCAVSELYGLFLFANTFSQNRVKLITESKSVAERVKAHCVRLFSFTPDIEIKEGKNGTLYIVTISKPENMHRLILGLGTELSGIALRIDHRLMENECCRNSFIRGAFLSGGAVSSPDKAYHFEIATPRLRLSRDFSTLLSEFELPPKIIVRKSNQVIYFKDSSSIEDLLNIMGARKSEFDLINVKIVKELRNAANRVTNCETANITKTVEASVFHIETIKKLKKTGRFELLPDELKLLAKLRLKNPDISLKELGELFTPPLSKTGVNHRLKKIENYLNAKVKKKGKAAE